MKKKDLKKRMISLINFMDGISPIEDYELMLEIRREFFELFDEYFYNEM